MKKIFFALVFFIVVISYIFYFQCRIVDLHSYFPTLPTVNQYHVLKIKEDKKIEYRLKVKFVRDNHSNSIRWVQDDGNYKILAITSQGLSVLKDVDESGSYREYSSPVVWIPKKLSLSRPFTQRCYYIQYLPDGKEEDRGRGIEEIKIFFLGEEILKLSSGKFRTAKIFIMNKYREENGDYGWSFKTIWLAKNRGYVKEEEIFIKFKRSNRGFVHHIIQEVIR